MVKYFLLLFVLIIAFASMTTKLMMPAPNPLVCDTLLYDVGTVCASVEPIKKSIPFSINNRSDDTYSIKISTSCGCLVSSSNPQKIGPHESVDLKVLLDKEGPPGPFIYSVMVIGELLRDRDTEKLYLPLRIHGKREATSDIRSYPTVVNFGTVIAGEGPTARRIHISRHNMSSVEVTNASANSESLSATIGQPGERVAVTVTFDPRSVSEGHKQYMIEINAGEQTLTVPAIAIVKDNDIRKKIRDRILIPALQAGVAESIQIVDCQSETDKITGLRYEGDNRLRVELLSDGLSIRILATQLDIDDRSVAEGVLLFAINDASYKVPIIAYLISTKEEM